MQENLFLWERDFIKNLTEEIKREILILYGLGVTIDEIDYLIKIKFGKRIKLDELINFLFSSI